MFSPQDPLLSSAVHLNVTPDGMHRLDTILPDDIQQLSRLVEECKAAKMQARALQEELLLDGRRTKKAEISKVRFKPRFPPFLI